MGNDVMMTTDSKDIVEYEVATDSQRTLKDLKVRKSGQPVCAIGAAREN